MIDLGERGRVFGLGLSRTGTSSLTSALYRLGVNTKHYARDPREMYQQLRNGDYELDILKKRTRGLTDIPHVPYFAQLDHVWQGSKFILTIREKDAWLRSVDQLLQSSMKWWDNDPQYRQIAEFFRASVYGTIWFNRDRFSYVYDTHTRNVLHYFQGRPDDLLVIDICAGEGWEKLCPFFGVDLPNEPFPRVS